MTSRRSFLAALPALGSLYAATTIAQPGYPERPIRIVAPFGPGSATDLVARKLSAALNGAWHASVVVDNKPGAGGVIATDFVAKSAPDGYTLLVTSSTHYTNPWLEKTAYDAVADFEIVARLASTSLIFVTGANAPYKSVADVIRTARQVPQSITFGSSGEGSPSHVCGALLNHHAGISMVHAPYKNSSQVLIETANGQVSVAFAGPNALPLVKSGRLRVLAVTSAKRSAYLPDVPGMNEAAGIEGYDFVSPIWIFAPKGTSRVVLNRLSDALATITASADYKSFCAAQYLDQDFQSAASAKVATAAEAVKWRRMAELTKA